MAFHFEALAVVAICKLTKSEGKYVRAHLLPKALTRPEVAGAPFVESSPSGRRPKRAWSSWYDKAIVTADGEAILAEFDNWAIPELRRLKLVWSGWGPLQALPYGPDHDQIGPTEFGFRKISGTDFKKLRLFFLSLFWRAAASSRSGFADIQLSAKELDELGSRLVARDPGPASYFPTSLTQLSTLGVTQNLTPFLRVKDIPAVGDFEGAQVPYYRFYLDGLIAHIHPNGANPLGADGNDPLTLGANESATVLTVKYEKSFQHTNLTRLMAEAWRGWPKLMVKL
jgi:hypothetical protein